MLGKFCDMSIRCRCAPTTTGAALTVAACVLVSESLPQNAQVDDEQEEGLGGISLPGSRRCTRLPLQASSYGFRLAAQRAVAAGLALSGPAC